MSSYLCSYKSDKQSTSHTLPDSYNKTLTNLSSDRNTESSGSVANCIRNLNETIKKLSIENSSLKKALEESNAKRKSNEKKCKHSSRLREANLKMEKEILELKENNLELHERYDRVKEMYDVAVGKQNRVVDLEKVRESVLEIEELRKVNGKLKEENFAYLAEIESLKAQITQYKSSITELRTSKKLALEESSKSEKFVSEIAGINSELLRLLHKGKHHSSNSTIKKPSSDKKIIKKVIHTRHKNPELYKNFD